MRFLSSLVVLVWVMAGCGHAPALIGVENPKVLVDSVAGAGHVRVMITTTRVQSADTAQFYSDRRARTLGLAAVTVSIPPGHVPGALEAPKRLPPDPRREFAVTDPVVYERDGDFIAEVNAELARRAPKDRNVLLFVHGFNTTTSDAVLRVAQFTQDSGFTGVPVLFTWASAGKVTRYVYDLNSALVARQMLEEASGLLVQTKALGFDVFAHSMGTFLVTETMVQSALRGNLGSSGRLSNIMLAAPDIDIDLFRTQMEQIGPSGGNIFVLLSHDDVALKVSRRLAGGVSRVGAADDKVLADMGVTVIDLSAVHLKGTDSHRKYAASPGVVQVIGEALRRNHYQSAPTAPAVVDLLQGMPVLGPILGG